jgi:hypothetical protein
VSRGAVNCSDRLEFSLEGLDDLPTEAAVQAVVEGILFARYEYARLGVSIEAGAGLLVDKSNA